tara:strand:- start:694 stop:1086 length:393 start_codon:yes stop_codon:yes gene_type:complete
MLVGYSSVAQEAWNHNRIDDFLVLDTVYHSNYIEFECMDTGLNGWEFFIIDENYEVEYYMVSIISNDNVLDMEDTWVHKGTSFETLGYMSRKTIDALETAGKYKVSKHDVEGLDGYDEELANKIINKKNQ